MKNLFLASLVLMSTNVFASKMVNIKSLTNPTLDNSSQSMIKLNVVSHSALKKVIELKGKGNSAQEIRMNTVAQALHTVCRYFDEGVEVTLDSKDEKGNEKALAVFLDNSDLNKGDADYETLSKSISNANKEAGVELYSGSAGGNNTFGTVLGLYDTKNNEIAVFANTNCGSDD